MVPDISIQQTEAGQKRIQSFAFVIGASAAVCIALYFALLSFSVSGQSQGTELEGRINPNEASVASLMRLPGIGITRAGGIAAYRRNFAEEGKGGRAFETINDLQNVKGIGPKTAEKISEWLKFE